MISITADNISRSESTQSPRASFPTMSNLLSWPTESKTFPHCFLWSQRSWRSHPCQVHCGGLLQQDPQDDHQRAQVRTSWMKVHLFVLKPRYALVWGTSAKHQPMRVGKDHVLHDEDVVQIVKSVKWFLLKGWICVDDMSGHYEIYLEI